MILVRANRGGAPRASAIAHAAYTSAMVRVRAAIIVSALAIGAGMTPAAQTADLPAIITRVGDRVAEYYRRARHVMCVETSTMQPIQSNLTPAGMSRTVESELRIEAEDLSRTAASATVVRSVLKVNGRAPRPQDSKDRSGCTDPNPLSPEPLAFLTAGERTAYRFTSLRSGKEGKRAAFVIEFESADRTSRPELVEDPGGHDSCFDWTGPIATRGRVWVDQETYDVLRVDRYITGPVNLEVSGRLRQRHNFGQSVVIDRNDQSIRFKTVAFHDPDEVMLLPESIQSLTILRGGLQSSRRSETFRNYRRFLGSGRVVK